MPNMTDIIITPDMLKKIAEIDSFNGAFNSGGIKIKPEELKAMKRIATIESIGSSNRIEGNKLNDFQVEEIFNRISKKSFQTRDEQEVAGYADLVSTIFENYKEINLSENYIRQLHKILLSYSDKDERHRGEYKKDSNRVAAFNADGKEIGTIFETASPFDTPRLMQELVNWTNINFNDGFFHPIIIIGVFVVHFLSIHPFTDGNGRMSRALTTMLMLQHGYNYMPYSSLESIIEASKDAYYIALRATQKTIWSDKVNYEPWLTFFVTSLAKQKRHLEEKIAKSIKTDTTRITKSEQTVLDLFKDKTNWSVAEMAEVLSKNNETVKKTVQNLVKKNKLEKQGYTKGTYYVLKG
jgi:Fic family protein